VAVQSPHITDEPPASADRVVHDESLTTADSGEVVVTVEATYDQHLDITADAEQHQTPPPASTEAFHDHVEVAEKQEAEEELVERADSHVEESMHTAAHDQEVSSEQPPDTVQVEEARRQRVAAKLSQMGAFNPLTGPPSIPLRQSFDEPALAPSEEPHTEDYGETIPSPPAVPTRHDAVQSFKHDVVEPTDKDDAKVDEDDRVPAHRDGES
jgi:hypothetical protein